MTPGREGRRNDLRQGDFPGDLIDFVRELQARQVEFLLVGGYAVGVYGHVRATTDIDFLYRRTPGNIIRLVMALEAFGAPPVVIDPDHLANPDSVTAFGQPPHRIDLLAGITGVTYDEAAAHAITVELAELPLRVIGLDALRANKRATGRQKDLDDLRRLPVPPMR